jgi:hypothetical protein
MTFRDSSDDKKKEEAKDSKEKPKKGKSGLPDELNPNYNKA